MRYLLITVLSFWLLGLSTPIAQAQYGRSYRMEDLKEFKATTLIVVLYPGDSLYNGIVKRTLERSWKLTPYRLVPLAQLREYAFDSQYSMLVRNNSKRIVQRVGRTDQILSNHLAIYICGRGDNLMNYSGADAMTHFHLPDVMDTEAYAFKLSGLLQTLHQYLVFMDAHQANEDKHEKLLDQFLHGHEAELGNKILLVRKEDLPEKLQDLEKLRKLYPHALEFVSGSSIQAALDSQRKDAAFLHMDPRIKELYVISTEDGKVLYQARILERGFLKGKDFSLMAKTIAKR